MSLKLKTVSGVKWQVANKVLQKGLSVVTFAILARLLEPSVFGLFAMAFILIDGLDLFKSMGFDSALIQRKESSAEVQQTAFVLTQMTGWTIFTVCFIAAPFAGKFFDNLDVVAVIRALGVVFILSTLSKIPSAILTKQMRFKILSVAQLIGSVLNSILAVCFAMLSPTIWSLVWAYLIKQSVITGIYWYYSGFRFKLSFDRKIAGELFHYGKFMVGVALLWYISANLSNITVAKILGATALGYLALAQNITNFVNTHFTFLISRVLFPAYSSLQSDPVAIKRAYLKTIRFISMFTVPFSLLLICLATPLVRVLYGEKWLATVVLIQILAIIHMFTPFMASMGSVFNGVGKPKYSYQLAFVDLVLRLPALIYFTNKWGVEGAVIAGLMTLVIMFPLHLFLLDKVFSFSLKEFARPLLPSILSGVLMCGVIVGMDQLIKGVHLPLIVNLGALAVVGSAFYLLGQFLFDRESSLEAKQLFMGSRGVKA